MPYLNVAEVESALVHAEATYPGFIQRFALPNNTWEGRSCHAVKIANGTGSGRIGIYLIAGVHAREWVCPDSLVNFIEKVALAYSTGNGITLGGKSFTAGQIQNIVNQLDIIVFPQVNPDGRNHSLGGADINWRKNRRPAPAAHSGCTGVDINRNFNFLWDYPTYFHPLAPIANSTDPCDYEVYIGPGAASEPETRNVVSIMDNNPNIRFFVDVHSYSELVLYNWGDDDNQSTNSGMNFRNAAYNGQRGIDGDMAYREYIDACDESLVAGLATRISNAIQAVRGKSYTPQQSFELYPTAGTTMDYAFSRWFEDRSNGKVRAFIIETGDTFWPTDAERGHLVDDVAAGLLELCVGVLDNHADVYIKDNPADTGAVPSAGQFLNNSDVIVRQADDDVFAYQQARHGQTNYIYVRITNLGPNPTDTVLVSARAVRFPGTEFDYPYDWETIDATHIDPTVVVDTFNNIPVGATKIAKFSLSPSQVNALWGWQSGGWHPCLLASVDGCNDFGSPAGVHVWQDNNLGQRNLSIVPAIVGQHVSFAFVLGHTLNTDAFAELVIDRTELPAGVDVIFDPLPPRQHFEYLPTPTVEAQAGEKVKFLDRTRLEIDICGCKGVLTLNAGSTLECAADLEYLVPHLQGVDIIQRDKRRLLAVREPKGLIRLRKQPGEMRQAVVELRIPDSAKVGDVYRLHVSQRNEAGRVVGGVTLELPVVETADLQPDSI